MHAGSPLRPPVCPFKVFTPAQDGGPTSDDAKQLLVASCALDAGGVALLNDRVQSPFRHFLKRLGIFIV